MAHCANCGDEIPGHEENGCVLAALVQVIKDRGFTTSGSLLLMLRDTNVDALWDDLGPIIDQLEAGEYMNDDDKPKRKYFEEGV